MSQHKMTMIHLFGVPRHSVEVPVSQKRLRSCRLRHALDVKLINVTSRSMFTMYSYAPLQRWSKNLALLRNRGSDWQQYGFAFSCQMLVLPESMKQNFREIETSVLTWLSNSTCEWRIESKDSDTCIIIKKEAFILFPFLNFFRKFIHDVYC